MPKLSTVILRKGLYHDKLTAKPTLIFRFSKGPLLQVYFVHLKTHISAESKNILILSVRFAIKMRLESICEILVVLYATSDPISRSYRCLDVECCRS